MELALYVVAVVVITGLSITVARLYYRFRKSIEKVVQLEIDKITLSNRLLIVNQEIENYKLGETEEFLQFLSKSRQWAFDFIEEFQGTLDELFKELDDPEQNIDTEKVLQSFIELKKYLPKDKV